MRILPGAGAPEPREGGEEYVTVVGASWAPADEWRRRHPDRPFIGVRIDQEEIWVAFEPTRSAGPVTGPVLAAIQDLFEGGGREAWCDKDVFLSRVRSVAEGHRLARLVVAMLRAPKPEVRDPASGLPPS